MRASNSKFPRQQTVQIGSPLPLSGLHDFLKDLERFFFAEASAKFWIAQDGAQDLVVHLVSPLRLLEVLHHHRRGHWGTGYLNENQAGPTRLEELLNSLEARNMRPVDIEELTLELDDVMLVIRKCGTHSIPCEFDRLLETLAAHFVYLTCGLEQMPNEIYIPALEEREVHHTAASANDASDLYGYWAAYFDHEVDARIYDLAARQTLSGTSLVYGISTWP